MGAQHHTPEYRAAYRSIKAAQQRGEWLVCVQPICLMRTRDIAPTQRVDVAQPIREVGMVAGTRMPPQFLKYWLTGPGAAKIAWGTPGDFDRAVTLIQEAVTKNGGKPLSDRIIKGLVATLHKMATGARPGHAPGERMA